jgi:LysM repeat protein
VNARTRAQIARFAAPAAFLLAVTLAVLLVRAGLDRGGGTAATTTVATTTTARTTTTRPTTTSTPRPPRQFYEIESGDTFATIAAEFDTTVEELLLLNPDVDPQALRIGQRVRVR